MTENDATTTLKKASAAIVDEDRNTKLHYLAAAGNETELLEELENEHKLDIENFLGWTPLMMACRNGHLNVVQLLLKHRADATRKNRFGMSVFLLSVSSGNMEIVHLVLQHLLCGGVSRQSMQKWLSPLSVAILFSHQHIVCYLIEQSFDLNAATPLTGITPLMFGSAMENCEAFTLLTKKGADHSLKNCSGFTARGIIEFRNKKLERKRTETNNPKKPPTLLPSDQHLQPPQPTVAPYFMYSPQPTFYQLPPNNNLLTPHIRKSSNAISPGFYFTTPNVTPITPVNVAPPMQMFFPPEFSPNQVYGASPIIPNYYNNNEFLNARMNSPAVYVSPVPQAMNYPSPCI